MATPSISQSDEFSDILLAAGPITSDINSVDFDRLLLHPFFTEYVKIYLV